MTVKRFNDLRPGDLVMWFDRFDNMSEAYIVIAVVEVDSDPKNTCRKFSLLRAVGGSASEHHHAFGSIKTYIWSEFARIEQDGMMTKVIRP